MSQFPANPPTPQQPDATGHTQPVATPPATPPAKATFKQYLRSRDFLSTFVALFFLAVALPLLVLYVFMPIITRHNSGVEVPAVANRPLKLAQQMLDDEGLRAEVIDSQYMLNLRPLAVITQDPPPGEKVKSGRTVYLVVNRESAPDAKLPDIIDVNLSQAKYMLQNWGLRLGNVQFVQGDATELVLQASHNGKRLKPGDVVKAGTTIDLMVSTGAHSSQIEIPDLVGRSLDEATALLNDAGLGVGNVQYGNSGKYKQNGVVYQQSPAYPAKRVNAGYAVSLWVTGKREKVSEGGTNSSNQ
jgi:beta-lactam-binding protein with PASTA domain